MKNRAILIFAIIFAALSFTACEGDGDADYGFAQIYIPQATVSGGLNNHYPVPTGDGEYTYNFKVENGKVNVMLGVICAGKFDKSSAYTVDVAVLTRATTEAAAALEAIEMPKSLYTLPSKVDVPESTNGAAFYLSVDAAALKTATYSGKKLVLAVGIANPTFYELATKHTSVLVILDVDKINNYL